MDADQLWKALEGARSAPEPWRITTYKSKTDVSSATQQVFGTSEEFSEALEDDTQTMPVTPKNDVGVFSMATLKDPRMPGRRSYHAGTYTGILLDRDVPGSSPDDLHAILSTLRISHVTIWKPTGWHVLLQLATIVVPEYAGPALLREDDSDRRAQKFHAWDWYRSLRFKLRHLIATLGKLYADEDDALQTSKPGLDLSNANGLMHDAYMYWLRPESPKTHARFAHCDGHTLNLDAFCAATDYVEPEIEQAVFDEELALPDGRTKEEILTSVRISLAQFTGKGYKPKADPQRKTTDEQERKELLGAVQAVLNGKSIGGVTERYPRFLKVANQVALREPYVPAEILAEIFVDCLAATAEANPGATPRTLYDVITLIERGQSYGAGRRAKKRQDQLNFIKALQGKYAVDDTNKGDT